MEMLLNLAWIVVAVMALASFVGRRREYPRTTRVPRYVALMAIGCALFLLFPVVSASDDLHPTQAVLDDASKRIQQLSAALQNSPVDVSPVMLAALVAASLVCLVLVALWHRPELVPARLIAGARSPILGRSPPRF